MLRLPSRTNTQQRNINLGGSNGIGLAAAQRLARAKAEGAIVGRSQARLDAALAPIDCSASPLWAEFTDAASLTTPRESAGRIDQCV